MAKAKETDNRDIKALSAIEHIKLRANTYLGGLKPVPHQDWILDDNDQIQYKEVVYTEGLKKILNEAIDNSVDEYIKTNGEYSTKINITISKDTFICEDNGRGIPVKKTADGEWMPVLALCRPMSGSNFNDDKRNTIGMNGLGVKILSCFSNTFDAETCDGKGRLKINCKDGLNEIKFKELTPSEKTGTKITAKPNFERFGVTEFPEEIVNLIKTRLKFLSWFCPKCTFTLNNEKIAFKPKNFTSLFPQPSITISEKNVYICAYPSDEPYVLSFVNGTYNSQGGSHIDYVSNKITTDIREKLAKKYKNIKPSDIRNRLSLVVFFNNFPNPEFTSQTKECLSNSQGEIGEFLRENEIDLDTFTSKIIKEKEIMENITDIFQAKLDIADKKALGKLNKTEKNFDSEKYFPPAGKSKKKYLMVTEGFSAFSGISPILGRQDIGYYMLKGKPLNILDLKSTKFMDNKEVYDLVKILGIDLTNPDTDMFYDKVVVLSDADSDGIAIAGLIITLFSKIAPRMLKEGRICRMETPLLIGMKGDKIEEYYFEFPEKSKMKKTLDYKYLKGLGSWTKSRLNQVIEKEGGMDNLIKPYELDKTTKEAIQNWFGSDSEPRKVALRGREFHIDKA